VITLRSTIKIRITLKKFKIGFIQSLIKTSELNLLKNKLTRWCNKQPPKQNGKISSFPRKLSFLATGPS